MSDVTDLGFSRGVQPVGTDDRFIPLQLRGQAPGAAPDVAGGVDDAQLGADLVRVSEVRSRIQTLQAEVDKSEFGATNKQLNTKLDALIDRRRANEQKALSEEITREQFDTEEDAIDKERRRLRREQIILEEKQPGFRELQAAQEELGKLQPAVPPERGPMVDPRAAGFSPLGIFTTAGEVIQGPTRAVGGFAESIGSLVGLDVDLGSSDNLHTTAGHMSKSISQFAVGWGSAGIALKGLGLIKAGGKGRELVNLMTQGAGADFISFDGQEERLSNLLVQFPATNNAVTQYLAAHPDDSQAEGRLKNVLEGIGIGAMAEAMVVMVRSIKTGRRAMAAGDEDAAVKLIADSADEVDAIAKRAELSEPSVDAIEERAFARWLERGDARLRPDDFYGSARDELIGRAVAEGDEAAKAAAAVVARAGERKAADVAFPQEQLDGLAERMALVKRGEMEIDEAVVGIDFNLAKMTDDPAIGEILNMMGRAINREVDVAKGGVKTFKELEEGAEILGGDVATTMAVLAKDAKAARELTERFLNGKALLKNLAEAARQKALNIFTRGVDDPVARQELAELMDAFATTYTHVKAIQTGAARTTAAGRIMTGDFIKNVSPERLEILVHSLAQSGGDARIVTRLFQRNWLDKGIDAVNFFWYNAVLSHIKTHEINVLTALGESVMSAGEQVIGGVLGGDKRQIKEGLRTFMLMWRSMGDSIRMGKRSFREGKSILSPSNTKFESVDAIGGATIGRELEQGSQTLVHDAADYTRKVIGAPSRALIAEDEIIKQMNYRAKIQSRAMQEAEDLGLEGVEFAAHVANKLDASFDSAGRGLDKAALDYAKDVTFMRDLEYGFFNSVRNTVNKHPAIATLLPFVRISTNLARKFFSRTPGAQFMVRQFRQDLRSVDPAVRSVARGKLVTGAAIWGTFSGLAYMGKITGRGPTDPELRQQMIETGWRPYSYVMDDGTSIPLDRYDPLSTVLKLMGDYAQITGEIDWDEDENSEIILSLMAATARDVTSTEWLSGVSDTIDAMTSDDRKMQRFLQQRAASFIPNGLRVFNQDPFKREARSVLDALMVKIPGLSGNLPPRRNMFGEKIMYPNGYGFETISPFWGSRKIDDPVRQELSDLQHGFSLAGPTVGNIELREFKNDKGQDAYDRLLELHGIVRRGGKTLAERVSREINSAVYQSLPEVTLDVTGSRRIQRIQRIIGGYRLLARRQLNKEFPELRQAIREDARNQRILERTGELPQSTP